MLTSKQHMNTWRISFLIIATLVEFNMNSQIYLDNHFHILKDKSIATYYRIIDSTENDIVEKTYFINDTIYQIIHYSTNGFRKQNGKHYEYYESGKLKYDIDYANNKLNGYVRGYFENGNKRRVDLYKNDTLIEGKCFTHEGFDTSHYIYSKTATYKGQNLEGFRRFVASKVKYPKIAIENKIQGRVVIEFSVNSKGEVGEINVIDSPDDSLSVAAKSAIVKSELWEPCIYEGKKAKQMFIIPIIFSFK
jgi:protein TonB